jgi:F-type H+-transporting ATPase subunit delta
VRVMQSTVAKRYAAALYELATETKSASEINRQLESLAQAWEQNDNFRQFLTNPRCSLTEKKELIASLAREMKLHQLVVNTLSLMLEKGRISLLPAVSRSYTEYDDLNNNRVRGHCRSATSLKAGERKSLEQVLKKLSRASEVILTVETDTTLMAGFILSYRGVTVDGSLSGGLARLHRQMLNPSHND